MQKYIEGLTLFFKEESVFNPNLISKFLKDNDVCARVKNQLKNDEDLEFLSEFGHIEALIIYVLSLLLSSPDNTMVKAASLIGQLEYYVRAQADLLKTRRGGRHHSNSMPTRKDILGNAMKKPTNHRC